MYNKVWYCKSRYLFLNYISVLYPYLRTDFRNDFEIIPIFSSLPLNQNHDDLTLRRDFADSMQKFFKFCFKVVLSRNHFTVLFLGWRVILLCAGCIRRLIDERSCSVKVTQLVGTRLPIQKQHLPAATLLKS